MRVLEPLTFIGQHVRLEPLAAEHAPALHAAASEARGTFGFTLVPADLAGFERYIAGAIAERERGESMPFVVRDATGTIVGSTRYMMIEWWSWPGAPAEPVPSGPDALEIGFTWYAERVQRTALNTEAKLMLCTQAFDVWGVRRITWKTDARNLRSRAGIERLGAKLDGVLRANRPGADGAVRDTACYAMLRSEWPEAKARLAARLAS